VNQRVPVIMSTTQTPRAKVEQPGNRDEFNAVVRLVEADVIVNIGNWQCERVSGDYTRYSYMVTAPDGQAWWFPVAREAVNVLCEMTGGEGLNAPHLSSATFNAHATHHIGAIHFDGSETPVGINAFGLTFEDANYAVAARGHRALREWERTICEAMQRGEARGMIRGKVWSFEAE